LAFEACDSILIKEGSAGTSILLQKSFNALSAGRGKDGQSEEEDVGKILSHKRKENEIGVFEEKKKEKKKLLQQKKKRNEQRRQQRAKD
jgi:hypothetical protein